MGCAVTFVISIAAFLSWTFTYFIGRPGAPLTMWLWRLVAPGSTAVLDLSILTRSILERFRELRGARGGALVSLDRETSRLRLLGQEGLPGFDEAAFLALPDVATCCANGRREPLTFIGAASAASEAGTGPVTWTFLPLFLGERFWGAYFSADDRPEAARLDLERSDCWSALLGIASNALENARSYEMARELGVARQIQQDLLPRGILACGAYRIHGLSRPATQLGGDYFDFQMVGERHLDLFIGDVAGHGAGAAMGMVIAKTLFRQAGRDGLQPLDFLRNLNWALKGCSEIKLAMTSIMCRLDLQTHEMTVIHNGHVFPIHQSRDRPLEYWEFEGSSPLGWRATVPFIPVPFRLEPGERLYFFTDGMIEAMTESTEVDNFLLFRDYLGTQSARPIEEVCASAYRNHPWVLTGKPQPDDFSILVLERIVDGGGSPSAASGPTPAPVGKGL